MEVIKTAVGEKESKNGWHEITTGKFAAARGLVSAIRRISVMDGTIEDILLQDSFINGYIICFRNLGYLTKQREEKIRKISDKEISKKIKQIKENERI